jgi:hypothetical protein
MHEILEFFWRNLVTIVTAVVSFVTYKSSEAIYHRWYKRRLVRRMLQHEQKHGVRQAVLILSVGSDISETVLQDLRSRGWTGPTGKEADNIPIFTVHRAEAMMAQPGQWHAYLDKVKDQVHKLRETGITRLHLYTRLPVALAIMVGTTLSNAPFMTHVYHHQNGRYEPVGLLTFETTRL